MFCYFDMADAWCLHSSESGAMASPQRPQWDALERTILRRLNGLALTGCGPLERPIEFRRADASARKRYRAIGSLMAVSSHCAAMIERLGDKGPDGL